MILFVMLLLYILYSLSRRVSGSVPVFLKYYFIMLLFLLLLLLLFFVLQVTSSFPFEVRNTACILLLKCFLSTVFKNAFGVISIFIFHWSVLRSVSWHRFVCLCTYCKKSCFVKEKKLRKHYISRLFFVQSVFNFVSFAQVPTLVQNTCA